MLTRCWSRREGHYGAGRLKEAESLYRQGLALQPGRTDVHAGLTFGTGVKQADEAAHRLQHDREQQPYLADVFGINHWTFHLADGERVAGRSVNGANAARATQERNSNHPRIIVIDDLLSEEALAKLRQIAHHPPPLQPCHRVFIRTFS